MLRQAINKRIATAVIALGFALIGAINLRQLPVDFLPDIKYPLIKLSIVWRGATPDDIDRNLADPIERQMASVDGLDYLSSSSLEGLYQLDVNFRYGVDVDVAYQDSLAAFQRALRDLPAEIDPPIIIKADPSQLPVVQVVFESNRHDLTELRTWIDTWLSDRLLAAQGVAAVDIAGGLEREIRVLIDPVALEKHGLSLARVEQRLREENVEMLGGRVTGAHQETIVRTLGEFRDLESIRDIIVARSASGQLRLRDIARVEDGHEELRLITRLDGRPAVKVNIIKQADANTVTTVASLEAALETLAPAFPTGISYALVENQADYIADSIAGVRNTALEAAVLVVLTFFLFLGSPRQVAIIAIVLPVTLAANFFVMKLAGFSLNIFSLGGLVVAIGVLLDASTVVLENITRLRTEKPDTPLPEIAESGTSEVGVPLVAATLAFFALFVPFLIVPGMITLLFRELVLIVLSIVILSRLCAVFLVPMLAGRFLHPASQATQGWNERFNLWLRHHYSRSIDFVLGHRLLTFIGFIFILAGGGVAFRHSGSEFLPAVDDGRIMVKVRMPAGAALERMDAINREIEQLALGDPRVATVFTLTGGAVRGLYTSKIGNEGQVDIELVPADQRDITTTAYISELRPKVAKLLAPGARLMVTQAKMRGIRQVGQADIEVEINGAEIDTLFQTATQVANRLRQQPSLTNVYVSLDYSKPEWQVDIDRVRAGELGLTVAGIASTLRGYIGGDVITQYREGNELYDLRVIVPERSLATRDDVENFTLALPNGGFARLRDVASVRSATGPVEIIRRDQVKQVIVRADPFETDLASAQAATREALAEVDWPAGYVWSISGKAQQMAQMQGIVKQLLAYAVFFSFLVLAVQFNSLRFPFLVLLAMPFCLAGMGYGLWIAGQPFGATVIIGIMVVLAANANDAVLLIDTAEGLRKNGLAVKAATREAAILRMRPRLMTTLPVILGFVPLAFALESGGELLRPMAAGAIGGLAIEILVALYLVPALYTLFKGKTK
ncbi:RND transporter, HAE1/HME family, permease protein [Verrucomicrobiia bacterium DG1235]|nr:RND transporter, HAE1/HME family, permease protein [Verrucomicrobiae bacterium DG1235]